MDRTELFALTTRVRRATRLPDVIALCDEVERLACSATPPTVALQPTPVALHKPGCIECERRRKQTRDRVARSRRNKESLSANGWGHSLLV
jgi:hypothetical protein